MAPPIKQVSFSGGEVSPAFYARTDNVKYETGLRTLRNLLAMRHGGATMRPGTQYIYTAQNGGNAVRLIPFVFNETGLGQSYLLEFGNQYIAFYQNGGVVVTGASQPYIISSPYLQADLATLQFEETADVITITHLNYAPMELKRLAATNWTLTTITIGPLQAAPTAAGASGGNAALGNCTYAVTAVNASTGEESLPNMSAAAALPDSTHVVSVTWNPPAGTAPSYYNIYRSAGPSGVQGFIGIATGVAFSDTGLTPNFANTPPLAPPSLFVGAGNYPATVSFAQQRRIFANTNNNPIGFWASQPGDFYNFNASIPPRSSDAIFASIAGEQVNAIQHIVELKFILMLTAGAEIYIQGNGSGVITPSTINASVQSSYGSSPLKPLKLGDICLFNQALGSFIRDLAFDFSIGGYHGNDITIFASHLFENYQLADWTYQKVPDSIVWVARSDGSLLGCTYIREQQILAWHRHDFTNGTVENVCAIPENGQYAVYLSIKRTINGSVVRYIERMSSRIWTDILNATYLDCFSSYNGLNTTSITMTLTASGSFQTGSTAYQQSLTLTASAPFFTSNMVGHEIFLNDLAFTLEQQNVLNPIQPVGVGNKTNYGNQIRCIIQSVQSGNVATVTPNRAVPTSIQNTALLTWAHAVQSLSGLSYLAGQQVSIWADRFVVGSPLNTQISNVYTVSPTGTLTLDKPYAVIYVGLPMTADFQTLDIDTAPGFVESMLSSRKKTNKISIYLYNSRGFFAGSEDPDSNFDNANGDALFQLEEYRRGTNRMTFDEPPELVTDQDYVHMEARWNKNGRIFIRNVDPIPLTILAVSPEGDDKVASPYGKKV